MNSVFQNDLESLCIKCGYVLEFQNIQNENNKIIEEKGVAKRVFLNPYNTTFPTYQHYLYNPDTNQKRNKKIKDVLRLCEKFIPLQKVFNFFLE